MEVVLRQIFVRVNSVIMVHDVKRVWKRARKTFARENQLCVVREISIDAKGIAK